MTEEGKIIGCKMNGQSVTLEPGGQFELSGAPLSNLHQTCDEVNSHLYQAKAISEEVGVGFLGVGFDPKWTTQDVPIMPKNRYNIMRNYMPKVGTLGLDMMLRSCTIQVQLLRVARLCTDGLAILAGAHESSQVLPKTFIPSEQLLEVRSASHIIAS